jgi:hypothetical protein
MTETALVFSGRKVGPPYGLYTVDASDEAIREAFTAKYGYPPKEIIRTNGGVLAGPVKEVAEST